MAQGWRKAVLTVARRSRLEPQLRKVQRTAMGPIQRRNAVDDSHLALALAFALPADAVCVDVGANLGTILEQFVWLAPEGHHYAFEPLPELAADLHRRFPDVDVHEAVLAAEPGTATFYRALEAHTRSTLERGALRGQDAEEMRVAVEVLDEVVPDDVRVGFLKIDVEGAELNVLRGAARVLSRDQPIVALEHGGPSEHSREIHRLLSAAGLRIFDMDGGGPHDESAFLAALSARRRRRWNWLAHR